MDAIIEVIGKAQQPDGYISTRIILEKRVRFQNIHHAESLYKEVTGVRPRPRLPAGLIPYYAWSNRGMSQMTVWLPIDWQSKNEGPLPMGMFSR